MQNFLLESLWLTARQPHQSSTFSLTVIVAVGSLISRVALPLDAI
jgi:hypothetical protein